MKQLNFTKSAWTVMAAVFIFSSCKKDRVIKNTEPTGTQGIYVLNEGIYGTPNNSSITYHDIEKGTTVQNYFKLQNGKDLGTNASDLQQYGGKMYCVVTGDDAVAGDAYIEVMNLSDGKSIKRIAFSEAGTDFFPRHIAFYKNKAYVSSYNGYITKIDTGSLVVESRLNVGQALEGIAITNGKLYVANTDRYPFATTKKTSVAVVDLNTFTNKTEITVSFNPSKVVSTTAGDIFTQTMGSYAAPFYTPALDKLSSVTDLKVQTYNENLSEIVAHNNNVYVVTGDYVNPEVKILNTTNGTLGANVVKDGTALVTPYMLSVNPLNDDICISDANNYGASGKFFVFSSNGTKKMEFATGASPAKGVFRYSYK